MPAAPEASTAKTMTRVSRTVILNPAQNAAPRRRDSARPSAPHAGEEEACGKTTNRILDAPSAVHVLALHEQQARDVAQARRRTKPTAPSSIVSASLAFPMSASRSGTLYTPAVFG